MKKQIFTLEQDPGKPTVSIKTHLGKYLSANVKGELTASSDTKGPNEQFVVLAQPDGRWVFKGPHNYYLSGSEQNVHCFAREFGETEKWTIHLAIHPQVAMRNDNRSRYVHLAASGTELTTDELVPWGDDAMVVVEFHNGRYAIRASNRLYLSFDGKLVNHVGETELYILEFFESKVAFKTPQGKYLQPYGAPGKLCVRREEVGKDELFSLEDSHPQVTLIGDNGKFASNAQTEEVKCDPVKVTDHEIFQMEFHNGKWAFRNTKGKFWSVAGGSAVSAKTDKAGADELFHVEWHGPQVALLANNGKYVSMKGNGSFSATASSVEAKELFTWNLINRPQLILRSEYGFVASKGRNVIVANSTEPEVFQVESRAGKYVIKGANGKYWKTDADGTVSTTGDMMEEYTFELLAHSRVAIRNGAGAYFKAENSGLFKPASAKAGSDELFEF
jgi:fascin 1